MAGMQGHNKSKTAAQQVESFERPTPQPALQYQGQCQAKGQYKRHQEHQRQELRQQQELLNRGLPFLFNRGLVFQFIISG
jgi:hypothetical protein